MNLLGVLFTDEGVLRHPTFGPWEIGPAEIYPFGLSIAVGLIIGMYLAGRRGKQIIGVEEERFHNFGIWLIIIGWIFSHIFAVLTYSPREVAENPLILLEFWGMISSVGGVIGGTLAVYIWMRRNPDEDHLAWANLAAWTLAICFFFGRLGCTFAYDHPGKLAEDFGPWNWFHETTGIGPEIFPLAMPFAEHLGGGIRHNLGFYEAILWFAIMVLFLWLGMKPRRRGLYLWLLPLLYSIPRFFLDFLRAYPSPDDVLYRLPNEIPGGDPRYFGLTPAQYTAIVFLAIGIFAWFKLKDQPIEKWAIHKDDGEDSGEDDNKRDDEAKKAD